MNRLVLLLLIGLVNQIEMFNVDFYEKPNFEGLLREKILIK